MELPASGKSFEKGAPAAVVESVKAASDVYAPVTGEVVAANAELADTPEKINADAYAAWLFRLKPANAAELGALLDAAAYQKIADADKR